MLPDEATGLGIVPLGHGTVPVEGGYGAIFAYARRTLKLSFVQLIVQSPKSRYLFEMLVGYLSRCNSHVTSKNCDELINFIDRVSGSTSIDHVIFCLGIVTLDSSQQMDLGYFCCPGTSSICENKCKWSRKLNSHHVIFSHLHLFCLRIR